LRLAHALSAAVHHSVEEGVLDRLRRLEWLGLVLAFRLQGVLVKSDFGHISALSGEHKLFAEEVFLRLRSRRGDRHSLWVKHLLFFLKFFDSVGIS
jgi:hypothetical protein